MKELLNTHAPSQTINNNNNNTNTINAHQNIHIYLNTQCKDAMNIEEFVDKMTLTEDDYKVFLKNIFCNGSLSILKTKFAQMSAEERPLHCIDPVVNQPATFCIRSDDAWHMECESGFAYQMKCIEDWQTEDEKMLLTQFFTQFHDKLWDRWKELCKTDPRYRRIEDKMRRVTNSDDKMCILADLRQVIDLCGEKQAIVGM
jgi:hypothetical protein